MSKHIQKSKRIRIQILDAPPGTREHTSLAHAKRYVKQGAAEWVGPALRFTRRHVAGCLRNSAALTAVEAIQDAFPGRAVLPPPPGWAERMSSSGRAA